MSTVPSFIYHKLTDFKIREDLKRGGYLQVGLKEMKVNSYRATLRYRKKRRSGTLSSGFELRLIKISDEDKTISDYWRPAVSYRGERRVVSPTQLSRLIDACENLDLVGYDIFKDATEHALQRV